LLISSNGGGAVPLVCHVVLFSLSSTIYFPQSGLFCVF